MKITDKIKYLLTFCSDSERELFDKMYPLGVDGIKNKKRALEQVEATLNNRTKATSALRRKVTRLEVELSEVRNSLKTTVRERNELKKELVDANYEASTTCWEDQNWLIALQSAGVDNWSGYDYAQEIYQQMKGQG